MSPLATLLPNQKPRLLVVDDDAVVLSALGALLGEGHEVRVARRGRDALRLARLEPPDLVMLDVGLPDIDGYEICRRLKNDPLTAEVPVIFLTAESSDDAEVRGLQVGGADFISKPPRRAVVLARVANLVRMKRLTDRLHREAMTDGLTGLANRAHFDRTLQVEWLRAMRNGLPLGLLMVDIDHFKAYNDHYGHIAGDACLRRVADLVRNVVHRPSDLVARYGGEEFVVLLPETGLSGACRVAYSLIQALNAAGVDHAASPVAQRVTVSVGASAADLVAAGQEPWPVDSAFMHQPSPPLQRGAALVDSADQALYAAKHHERNQAWMRALDASSESPIDAPPLSPARQRGYS